MKKIAVKKDRIKIKVRLNSFEYLLKKKIHFLFLTLFFYYEMYKNVFLFKFFLIYISYDIKNAEAITITRKKD